MGLLQWAKPVRIAAFLLLLALTMLPLFLLPFWGRSYHQIRNIPALKDGEIDLSGYDFYERPEIPLDGEWEFYYDQLIVSQPQKDQSPVGKVMTPASWISLHLNKATPPDKFKASYRIVLKNCPGNTPLLVYIPNICSQYSAYINGQLVSKKGGMDVQTPGPKKGKSYQPDSRGVMVPHQSNAEVIIELENSYIGGLYLTPVLAEQGRNQLRKEIRNLIAAVCTGIMLVSIGCFICLMVFSDRLFYSAALIFMDILVFLRFLARYEFFDVLKFLFPDICYDTLNSVLWTATFYLPVIFLFCIRQLFPERRSKLAMLWTGIYELMLSPALFWCAFSSKIRFQFVICLIGYLPFLYTVYCLYQEVLKKRPYSLLVSGSFLFIICSIISAVLNDSGLLIINMSLFSPFCFVIAMLLQLALYIRRSFELQLKASETENLSLRLKDSETSLMLSQIQPHFIYNTLIAIHMMCLEEPRQAADTTMKFANFLRINMRFIKSLNPIPFSQELEHIKNYTDIEEIRFKGRLSMVYEIESSGFSVPALTIQPLVENAIHHGASKNIDNGTVILHTFETDSSICIEVRDDGPGFDMDILNALPEDSYGIKNIQFRLKKQVNGDIRFEAFPGKGTSVLVTIPKGGMTDEGNNH